jgi:exoribonuclease-2
MPQKIDFLQNRPRLGSIVLFVTRAGKVRLGKVLAEPPAGQEEFFIQDAGGARSRTKSRELLLNLGAVADGLEGAQQQMEKAAEEIDIELLLEAHPEWQNGPAIPVRAIAEEYFGKEADSIKHAAMYFTLQRDSRFTIGAEKVLCRPPTPVSRRKRNEQQRQKERQELFDALRATITEALQKDWGAAEIDAHPLGKRLTRLARAALEQRRLYPEAWRKEFIFHLHSLSTLSGYRDARHLLFHWLKKIGAAPAETDLFIFSEPLLQRHSARLAKHPNLAAAELATDFSSALSATENQSPPEFVVTIDNPETTDRDDALSLRQTASGFEIGVHTPLLGALVAEHSVLDQWAYDVGASAYLPHRTVPMLPPVISSDMASLNAGGERQVLSFYFTIAGHEPPRFSRAVSEKIIIGVNTDYERVDALLAQASTSEATEEKESRNALPELLRALQIWSTEAGRLQKQRLANGARTFDRDEVDVRVDSDGTVRLRRILRDSLAHKMVAEWMIGANQAAAQFCHEHQLPCIYRVQESLLPERDDEETPSSRGRVRAQLKPERAPHRDLGVDGYTQITSPLRRYGDLVMQRQILSFLQTGKPCYSQTDLWARAFSIEEATRRIQRLESRADFYWKSVYLSQHLGEPFLAQISHSRGAHPRVVLQLPDLDLRLFVPASGIEGIAEQKIPPPHSPKQVQAVCLEMDADKGSMRFQIK